MSELSDRLREAAGSRSINEVKRLIEEAGKSVSRQTVAVFLRGDHGPRPTEEVLEAFAAGLQIDIRELRELAGRARGELGPWVPTQEAASLTKEQRDAMDALIKTIVKEGGSDSGQDEAQKNPSDGSGGGSVTQLRPGQPDDQPDEEDPYMRPAARKGTLIPPADD